MLVKLHKKEPNKTYYWEAWDFEGDVIIHCGSVGETGQTRTVRPKERQSAESVISDEASKLKRDGYEELEPEDLISFSARYKIDGMGTSDDLNKRHLIEEIFDEALGWTGNGECDGGDIGAGTMNIHCYVVDPKLALATALGALTERGFLEGATIAYEDDESEVLLWPKDGGEIAN